MSNRWFRYYEEALFDPKIRTLPDNLHRCWVGCLCLASMYGGVLPDLKQVAWALGRNKAQLKVVIGKLTALGLLDVDAETGNISPHNWFRRQYKTDKTDPTHFERVSRQRVGSESVKPDSPSLPESEYRDRVQKQNQNPNVSTHSRADGESKAESKQDAKEEKWDDLVAEMGNHYFNTTLGGNVPNSYGFIEDCKQAGFSLTSVRSHLHDLWQSKPTTTPKYIWNRLVESHSNVATAKAQATPTSTETVVLLTGERVPKGTRRVLPNGCVIPTVAESYRSKTSAEVEMISRKLEEKYNARAAA